MPFSYTKVLIIGATSGIGEALASKMVSEGISVIVTGRRDDRLSDFLHKHGEQKASKAVLDITKLADIPAFASDITSQHPDLDCVVLNSGIQRPFDFSKPDSVDLAVLEEELGTNYTSYMHLTKAFLPHLQKQGKETSLIFMSSGLALVPIMRCPNYCATKAALHHFCLCLREQLKRGPGNVKVVEILPPAVQTELHDEKHQPDIKNGRSLGMPLDAFLNEAWNWLTSGRDQIPVGMSEHSWGAFEETRQQIFQKINNPGQ